MIVSKEKFSIENRLNDNMDSLGLHTLEEIRIVL